MPSLRGNKIGPELPLEPNSFVGREHELDELRMFVPATRLLTLTGPGGIGKTRLAMRLLTAMAPQFPDGTPLVELASLSHPDMVVPRVAATVGVTEEQGRPLIDTLGGALRGRRILLGLDTCEHLIDALARLCQHLLATSPQLRIVATSREPLRVAGESVWSVPPLAVAADGNPGTMPEAARLFADRAQAAMPGFAVAGHDTAVVTALCQALDGIPLAIELAAARVRALSVEQIRERLADRFGLLTMGMRTAPERQRTLRAAIDWSHDLLTGPEQVLLRRLSVFAGWSLEMAEKVCTDDDIAAADMLDLLAALVDKSLVVREPQVLGQARYRLLDTIREYASGKLAAAGEGPAFRRRHRDYVLAVLSITSALAWRSCPRRGPSGSTLSAGTTWMPPTCGRRSGSAWPTATWRRGCGCASRSGPSGWSAASTGSARNGWRTSCPRPGPPRSGRGCAAQRSSGTPSCCCPATRSQPSHWPGPASTWSATPATRLDYDRAERAQRDRGAHRALG